MTIEERVTSIEARLGRRDREDAARELFFRYARCCDTNDFETMASLFAPDATLAWSAGSIAGREAIREWYRERLVEPTKHYITNSTFVESAAGLRARSEFLATHARGDLTNIAIGGYEDVVTFGVDGAQFSSRSIVIDSRLDVRHEP